jgi:hypothetical protein
MECGPTVSAEVESDAAPLESGIVPREVAPSKKVTLPVGVPEPALTCALNVTDCPNTDGFRVEATVAVVPACCTDWERTVDVLEAWLESPP